MFCRSELAWAATGAAVVSQRLMAENTLLRESIQQLNVKVSESEGEYWR